MFLRKLTVLFLPLLMLLALCLVLPLIGSLQLYFFSPVIRGLLLGVVLALVLPLSGATRNRAPFAGLLWVPAFLILLVLVWQYLASTGLKVPVLDGLATGDAEVVMTEAVFCGFLFTQCIRTGK